MMTHHAVLIIGEAKAARAQLPDECSSQHADVEFINAERFSISDARTLKERAGSKPVSLSRRYFILTTDEIQREAQHALLKLIEDPPATAQFFVILRDDRFLLSTLRSRFHVIRLVSETHPDEAVAHIFLHQSYKERLEEIADRMNKKDVAWGNTLFRGLASVLTARIHAHKNDSKKELLAGAESILLSEAYYQSQGASKKMLLEHTALSLPELRS